MPCILFFFLVQVHNITYPYYIRLMKLFAFQNTELIWMILILYAIVVWHITYGCCRFSPSKQFRTTTSSAPQQQEGMTTMASSTLQGKPLPEKQTGRTPPPMPPSSSWDIPKALSKLQFQNAHAWTQKTDTHSGKSLFFDNTDFKAECCPGVYTTGSGCACMDTQQKQMLATRGHNNDS